MNNDVSLSSKHMQPGSEVLLDSNNSDFKKLLDFSRKISLSRIPVLITGETGTGKEIIANFIHANSDRSSKNFVAVNCGAIPEPLLENELFGHVRGAYTDADSDYKGKIEEADMGTLFLDEIGEMPLSVQSKILRVIENGVFEPLGSGVSKNVDIRILSATNKNLSDMVLAGKFRKDLFYRINVIPLKTIELRNRKEDIETLANFFLKSYNRLYSKNIIGFERSALEKLSLYGWPGNIRELKNLVEKLVITIEAGYIRSDMVSIDIIDGNLNQTLKVAINNFKKEYITKILKENKWNQSRSCKVLDIQRTYLARLIRELDINKIGD